MECDGATYHSSATARDRDRLRQSVLEGLGWRLCRIWSTDWLRNREKQVQRVLAALTASPQPPAPTIESVPAPVEELPPPVPVPVSPAPLPAYGSIDDVPELVIHTTVIAVVSEYGATESDDLCGAVSRRLGFKRLGAKIKSRVEGALAALARDRRLERQADGRWGVAAIPLRQSQGL